MAKRKFTDEKLIELHGQKLKGTEMAKRLGVTKDTIYVHAKRIGLKLKGGWTKGKPRPLETIMKASITRAETKRSKDSAKLNQMLGFLYQNGVTRAKTLRKTFRYDTNTFSRVLRENVDLFEYFHLSWSSGNCRGGVQKGSRFIKQKFLAETFIGLKSDRTAIVRFFMGVFHKKKYGQYDAKAISNWLRSFGLSRAERVAVITSLGYKYTSLKHMMVDGWLDSKPGEPKTVYYEGW